MDHSTARPHCQQDLRDPRYAPIPPLPFSARPTSARPDILHHGDPFFQRRVETSDPHRKTIQSQAYGFINNQCFASASTGLQRHEQTRGGSYGPIMQDRHDQLRQYGSPLPDGRALFLHPRTTSCISTLSCSTMRPRVFAHDVSLCASVLHFPNFAWTGHDFGRI